MASVELQSVTRCFNNVTAIEDITFKIPDGEFWVLVGPSGCGKSTLLRSIAGLESITSGNLYIGDRLMNHVPARERDVSMVFQNYALYPHMTVAQNLAFGLQMRQVDPKQIKERVETVARSLSISHLLNRKPRQLSGGQQQRVALGRAIARSSQLFLLDEPLSNLDAKLRDETRAEIKQLHNSLKITTIYVTHDQIEAMTLANQIVVLNQGKIQQIDTPDQLYTRPNNRMVATFLGCPPMNILPAVLDENCFWIEHNRIPIPDLILNQLPSSSNKNYDLGIRPEAISIKPIENPNHAIIDVIPQVIEPLGRETLVRCSLLEKNVIINIIVGANWLAPTSSPIKIHLDIDQLFVFDSHTGQTLYPRN